ncbi:hypothetical protein [Lactococcus lactis]|uniref:hypothetical protein n=1 Tax=Lactococcus lactis TaxID=1358 RepID=UPI001D1951E4|nr:hypothetical protein [Lactococcus lactis]MCC4121347.1 hypothetical protein [Lactococcus lactis]
MSSNWGIKTDDGYVNFIHGTIDKVWDFETSSSIDDIVIFSERAAKGYAKAIKANAIQISISEQSQLTIPKSIAEMIDKEIMADAVTKFAMFHEGFERLWLSDELEMYCADKENYALASAYLAGKALGVDLVKVV